MAEFTNQRDRALFLVAQQVGPRSLGKLASTCKFWERTINHAASGNGFWEIVARNRWSFIPVGIKLENWRIFTQNRLKAIAMSRFPAIPIENCERGLAPMALPKGLAWEFRCPMTVGELQKTDNDEIRYCNICQENVYICRSEQSLHENVENNRCVVVDLNHSIPSGTGSPLLGRIASIRYKKQEMFAKSVELVHISTNRHGDILDRKLEGYIEIRAFIDTYIPLQFAVPQDVMDRWRDSTSAKIRWDRCTKPARGTNSYQVEIDYQPHSDFRLLSYELGSEDIGTNFPVVFRVVTCHPTEEGFEFTASLDCRESIEEIEVLIPTPSSSSSSSCPYEYRLSKGILQPVSPFSPILSWKIPSLYSGTTAAITLQWKGEKLSFPENTTVGLTYDITTRTISGMKLTSAKASSRFHKDKFTSHIRQRSNVITVVNIN